MGHRPAPTVACLGRCHFGRCLTKARAARAQPNKVMLVNWVNLASSLNFKHAEERAICRMDIGFSIGIISWPVQPKPESLLRPLAQYSRYSLATAPSLEKVPQNVVLVRVLDLY